MAYDSSDNYACYASNRILDLSFRVATRGLYVSEGRWWGNGGNADYAACAGVNGDGVTVNVLIEML